MNSTAPCPLSAEAQWLGYTCTNIYGRRCRLCHHQSSILLPSRGLGQGLRLLLVPGTYVHFGLKEKTTPILSFSPPDDSNYFLISGTLPKKFSFQRQPSKRRPKASTGRKWLSSPAEECSAIGHCAQRQTAWGRGRTSASLQPHRGCSWGSEVAKGP